MSLSITIFLLFCINSISSAMKCMSNPSSAYFTIGNATALVVSDGPIAVGGNYFSVPDEVVAASYASVYRPVGPLIWQQNIVVVDAPVGRILIDTGAFNTNLPPFAKAGQLIPNLHAAGIYPASIDYVLLTHGHPDHVSGLIRKDGSARFRNARVFVPRMEHNFWMAENLTNPVDPEVALPPVLNLFQQIYKNALKAYNGKITLVNDGETPLQGFKFTLRHGHTPGHSVIEISMNGERVVVTGDAWFSQPDQIRHPEWVRPVETDGLQGYRSRVAVMEDLAKSGDRAVAFHEDFPGIGRVVKTAYGYDWVPARLTEMDIVKRMC